MSAMAVDPPNNGASTPSTSNQPQPHQQQQAQVQPCRYKTGKTLGAGSYSVVKECVHIDTGRYYAAKVINKRLMAGREHMVRNEIAVLKKVSMGHQNILTLVDYFETMNNCKTPRNKQMLAQSDLSTEHLG
jgi:calcium/calmodulin-dependent protein kinase I